MNGTRIPSGKTLHPNDNQQRLDGQDVEHSKNDNLSPILSRDRVFGEEARPTALKGHDGVKDSEDAGRYLEPRQMITMRPSADTTFSDLSFRSSNHPYARPPLRSPSPVPPRSLSEPPVPPPKRRPLRVVVRTAWLHGKGMLMVILAQFFGASMNVMTQLLEKDGSHGMAMHPFQILFTRMTITIAASYLYMWYTQVAHPFGTRDVWRWLVLRAVGGFFGVIGMYYSLLYMPIAEATVLTFLSPIATCYACSFLMQNEPFTRKQQLAGLVSLLGVALIANPFSGGQVDSAVEMGPADSTMDQATEGMGGALGVSSASQHLMAIGFSLVGVCGAACATTSIRLIGTRAHALVSVTYFSSFTTVISLIAMLAIPSVSFRLPENLGEWGLLLGLGLAGFTMQYLLTAGLAYEPPSGGSGYGTRATSMVYTQMLFALFYDKVVLNRTPSAISWAGSGLILGCALYVAIARESNTSPPEDGLGPPDGASSSGRKDILNEDRDVEEGQGLLAEPEEMELEDSPESSSR